MNKAAQDRIYTVVDQADGHHPDMEKVKKQFAKNKWDFPQSDCSNKQPSGKY